jgi:uncharacterized protein (TIGR02118 family)
MTAKLIVLYPKPLDPDEFEEKYHSEHMPLMRKLVGPDIPLPTYRTFAPPGLEPSFYRVAEIHFPDRDALSAYLQSDRRKIGQESAWKLSTGGAPTVLLCSADKGSSTRR